MTTIILGGGFIGQLLQATVFPDARVFDAQPHAPLVPHRQMGPQYLWEPIPELTCCRFDVHTRVNGYEPTDADILAYKKKVGKQLDNSDWRAQFRPLMHGYECQLPASRVEYDRQVKRIDLHGRKIHLMKGIEVPYDLLVTTLPMPLMIKLCGLIPVPLESRPIYMHCAPSPPAQRNWLVENWTDRDMWVNYISSDHTAVYRETFRDGHLYTESLEPFTDAQRVVKIDPGKIYDNDDAVKMVSLFSFYSVLCCGRFASWNADELAHETLRKARLMKEQAHA